MGSEKAPEANSQVAVATANLTFNALGQRVYRTYASPSSPVSYWLDPAGNYIGGIWAGALGSGWNAEVPFAARILAMYNCPWQGPMCFDHPNALGAGWQWTTAAGSSLGEVQFYSSVDEPGGPWGQGRRERDGG